MLPLGISRAFVFRLARLEVLWSSNVGGATRAGVFEAEDVMDRLVLLVYEDDVELAEPYEDALDERLIYWHAGLRSEAVEETVNAVLGRAGRSVPLIE